MGARDRRLDRRDRHAALVRAHDRGRDDERPGVLPGLRADRGALPVRPGGGRQRGRHRAVGERVGRRAGVPAPRRGPRARAPLHRPRRGSEHVLRDGRSLARLARRARHHRRGRSRPGWRRGHRRDRGRRRSRGAGRLRDGDHRRVHRGCGLRTALGGGPAEGRAPVRASRRAHRPPARLRLGRRRARPGGDGARRDRRRTRSHRPRRTGVRPLGLRREHAHGDGARAGDRLRALHPQPVSRGAESGPRGVGRDHGRRSDGEPCRALQRDRVRARDVRDAARPGHDPPQPRSGGDPRRDRVGRGGSHPPAGDPRPAGRRCERAADPVARTPDRAKCRDGGADLVAHRPRRDARAARQRARVRGRARRARRPGARLRDGLSRHPLAPGPVPVEAGIRRSRGVVRGGDRRQRAGRRRGRRPRTGARGGGGRDRRRRARGPCLPRRGDRRRPRRAGRRSRGARRRGQPRQPIRRSRGAAPRRRGSPARSARPARSRSSRARPRRRSTTAS